MHSKNTTATCIEKKKKQSKHEFLVDINILGQQMCRTKYMYDNFVQRVNMECADWILN